MVVHAHKKKRNLRYIPTSNIALALGILIEIPTTPVQHGVACQSPTADLPKVDAEVPFIHSVREFSEAVRPSLQNHGLTGTF